MIKYLKNNEHFQKILSVLNILILIMILTLPFDFKIFGRSNYAYINIFVFTFICMLLLFSNIMLFNKSGIVWQFF